MKKVIFFSVIALLAGILPLSCQRDNSSKLVFVLFDLSGSTQTENVRERYLKDFNKILAKIEPGDRILVDYISESPLAQSSFPVNALFKKMDVFSDSELKYRHNQRILTQQILDTVKSMIQNPQLKVRYTKIMESLQLAERVFGTYTAERKYLVIFSDMIEESERYNFLRTNLNTNRSQTIIAAEKKAKRLPNLSGVHIFLVGAYSGIYQKLTQDQITKIQQFWLEYFKASGAYLKKENIGALLEFP